MRELTFLTLHRVQQRVGLNASTLFVDRHRALLGAVPSFRGRG